MLTRDRSATWPQAINFGMFTVIVVPLLRSLKWVNGYVGNYGWSIIVLTIIINVIMFPLRHKSVVSMRKMQEIQPEVKAIQDRYAKLKATDPGEAEDEPGDDGALQGARRQPGERLRADAVDDAGAASRSGPCCRRRSSCAARRSSAGSTISRRTIRTTSRRC